jgi:hypothetical protein
VLKHIDYLLLFFLVFWAAEMGDKESRKTDFNRWDAGDIGCHRVIAC